MASLTFLRRLVTVLTATMIIGVVVIIALLVLRLNSVPSVALPEQIVLPEGARATAYTQGSGWIAVVTDDNRILIFSPDGRNVRQEIAITQ